MREASFIDRNKEKWIQIETNLRNKINVEPDILASNYIELTNDLAYAQTFYPESKTRAYLNELAILAHQELYRDQKASRGQIRTFFTYEIPEAIWKIRRPLVYSLLIFCFSILLGFLSAHYDMDFVRLILGDYYVDMSLANIQDGNPAGVYQQGNALGGALAITINNIKVAFMAFVFGIIYSVGTGLILFNNGIMVGAFHHMFYEHGVVLEAMSAIWIHGAIELSVIVVAGGCGLAVGNSILFPGSFTRLESFKRAIKNASKVLVSTIPFFIVAGFLEGFITRHYQVSLWLCVTIILFSFMVVIYIYVLRPFQLAKINGWK